MAVGNVTRDVKGHCKSRQHGTHDKKASEVHFVEVFGVQEQVWNTQVLSKTTRYHCEQDDPAQHQDMVSLDIV